MKISGNEIKPGMLLEHKNDLWEVLKTQHVKPGKGGAFNQVEMKSLNKQTKLNERFRSSDTVERANLEEIKLSFLFEDERYYYFMNQKTFEQTEVSKKIIGEKNILNKLPVSASNLYAKNVFNFILNLYDKETKKININLEDEIIANTIIK